MNIREAILKAADHIERNPKAFNFQSIYVPDTDCGTPGCALGWIGHYLGMRESGANSAPLSEFSVPPALGLGTFTVGNREFYGRMDDLAEGWRYDASLCATGLRLYADKYHPAKVICLPDWNAIAAKQTVGTDAIDEMLRA